MTTKFIAEFKYGEPRLFTVIVTKETEKSLLIEGEPVKILGSWMYIPTTRISKDSYNIFNTLPEALHWLVSKANQRIISLKTDIENARQMASYLSKLEYEAETKNAGSED